VGGVPLDKPEWLSADACEVWDEIAPASPSMGIDRGLFAERLARYCERVARWRGLSAYLTSLRKDDEGCPAGYMYDENGREVLRPQIKEWLVLADACSDDEMVLYRVGVVTTIPKDRAGEGDEATFKIDKYA
jgi:hypothetical protein